MTRAELFEAAAKMMRMCDEAGIPHTYKFSSDLCSGIDHVFSSIHADSYEFPLSIVEGRPVFKGDVLYSDGIPLVVDYISLVGFLCTKDTKVIENPTWNPPRKTFMLNGEELPLPDIHLLDEIKESIYSIELGGWSKKEDRDLVNAALTKLLENK